MLLQSLCQLEENDFKGIDLVKNEAIVCDDTQGDF
jgi:hypothetical protein